MVVFAGSMQLVTASLLLVRNLSESGVFAAHYLSGTSYIVNPLMYGWASTICQRAGDDAVRSVVLYSMATGGQVLYTFWGIVMYPATDVPYWRKGSITMLVVVFVWVGFTFVVRWVSCKFGAGRRMRLTSGFKLDRSTKTVDEQREQEDRRDADSETKNAVAYATKTG